MARFISNNYVLPSQPTVRKSIRLMRRIFVLAVQSDASSVTAVDDYAENILAQHLSKISGVSTGCGRRSAEAGDFARTLQPGLAGGDGPDVGKDVPIYFTECDSEQPEGAAIR